KTVNKLDDSKIRLENVGFLVREPMLASGEVDAIFGFAHSTFITLKARGVPAEDIVVMLMADYGVELYGNGVIVSPKFLSEKPEVVKAFLRALTRSIREVVADPAGAIESVMRRNDVARRDVEIERLRMAVDNYVITPWTKANGFGGIDPNRWERAADQIGLTFGYKNKTRATDAFADVYLPDAAERTIPPGN
ncbi:MAG: ABC transporter substrate-binding protein, partial [Beijerinckiaceae bacterium]